MQPARAKAELMLLKPYDVKGDKAHLGSQGEEESQVCKLSPPSPAQRSQELRPAPCAKSGQGRNPCDALGLRGLSLAPPSELTAGTQPGCLHLTRFSLIKEENPARLPNWLWRSHLQQSPPSQPRHFANSRPKEIALHLLIYNY